ncbi:MAG: glycosyltransferase [Ilumatobacteraceae bacterium]
MADVNVFVSERGNAFMTDIARWIVEAAALAGRPARLVQDRLPAADGSVNLVVAPHEFFELFTAPKQALMRAAAASVAIGTEQPGTKWFGLTLDAARLGLLAYDINAHGVDALRAGGVDAHRLQLGAVPSMVAPATDRPVDVLFLGALDDRRGRLLAELAPRLVRRRCALHLFRFDMPVTATTPGLVFGPEKYATLAGATALLNLHRDRPGGGRPYFEWARMVEAMANGCVVVTEPSDGVEPLVPGEHFVEAPAAHLGAALDELLDDPDRLATMRAAARLAVTEDLALSGAVGRMLDHVESAVLPRLDTHVRRGAPRNARWRLGASQVPPPVRLGAFKPFAGRLRQIKRLAMAESADLRRLDQLTCVLHHGAEQHVERVETPAWAGARAEVSVIVSVYDYADTVGDALASAIASEGVDTEIVVVDDHATDDSRAVVAGVLAANPHVPMLLLGKDANEGLSAARNTAFEHARAPLVMVLDADNLLYPACLRKLADALHADPAAAGAYGILEEFGDELGLRSALAWDVDRLCRANYIDAQLMLRRDVWARLGGYRPDEGLLHGWEDWDLSLRIAGEGGHLAMVPEIVGRYRVHRGSMLSLTNVAHDDAIAVLRARHPDLPWPGRG